MDFDDVFIDDMFDTDDVSYNHEIDHNPKPEDAGRIKVYVSFQLLENLLDPIIDFSLPAKEYLDNSVRYSWDQLNCLVDEECLSLYQILCVRSQFTEHVNDAIFYLLTILQNIVLCYYMLPLRPVLHRRRICKSPLMRWAPLILSGLDRQASWVFVKESIQEDDDQLLWHVYDLFGWV